MSDYKLTYVDLSDQRVLKAIKFVEEEIFLSLDDISKRDKIGLVSWLYFTPWYDLKEKEEAEYLLAKYHYELPNNINYYLAYHRCVEFAVFYWTVLRVNGINCKIVLQINPHMHCYLLRDNKVLDLLFDRCEVSYTYNIDNANIYSTPHDLYESYFISKINKRDWEIEQLQTLKSLE